MRNRKNAQTWNGPALAWLNLIHAKTRFFVALSAIGFAVTLIFMQLGFLGAVLKTATFIYDNLNFDIVLISPKSLEASYTLPFSRQRLYQAAAIPGVASVAPFYISFKQWRNPETKFTRSILTMGFNPKDKVFKDPEINKYRLELQSQDKLLINRYSRPEFGSRQVGLKTELGGRDIEVIGFFSMTNSLRADGTVVMNDQNFIRLYTGRSFDDISLGLIKVNHQDNINKIIQNLRQVLPKDVEVLSREQAGERDKNYWLTSTSIGIIFGTGAIMAFIVGTVIVYQVLYSDITEHLGEYATLKAIGYSNLRLSKVVLQEAVILAFLGFLPGFFISSSLYTITRLATGLPMEMSYGRASFVFILANIMCSISALLSLRQVLTTDPADVF
ncbi:ABC transporter permease DevC [Calothrix sp. PCC 7507]|uniref:ABC transporter permease DevC n=1 Tax=Calothrix sp. PCC 7507 TaxID=99598 RepID=UPI00029EF796|nr:ABC transporter permease DevC [Calothrix sp. PCC 7507]AFY34301.1 DevC protein [Calothrix sp. PCC 7507]